MSEQHQPADVSSAAVLGGPFESLRIELDGSRLDITMDRPHRANALNDRMIAELLRVFDALRWRHEIRVVTLTGSGRHFCAGLDMTERQGRADPTPGGGLIAQRRISEIVIAMRRCPQPIVARINGAASGGGFALALAADVRVAAPEARFNAAFLKIGLSGCDIGVSYFLPRICGSGFASEFLLTGRFVSAERALAANLVSAVAAGGELDDAVEGFVADMLAASPLGLRLTKECLNSALDAAGLEQVIALEDRQQVLCTYEPDFELALRQFRDERAART